MLWTCELLGAQHMINFYVKTKETSLAQEQK